MSHKQLLDYILHDETRIRLKGKGFILKHNIRGRTTIDLAKAFRANEKNRINKRKDSTILQHAILSFSDADKNQITPEKLEIITKEFIRLRGMGGMYVAVPHFEKDHYHIHIVCSAIEYSSGKSLRLSKAALKGLKMSLQEYQQDKFPELYNSLPNHGKDTGRNIPDKEFRMKQNTKVTDKENLKSMLEKSFKKANSQEHFYQLLTKSGFLTYIRGGSVYGIIAQDGKKYRFKTLDFPIERINELNRREDRTQDLQNIRNNEITSKYHEQNISRRKT